MHSELVLEPNIAEENSLREITYAEALREATAQEMERNEDVFLFGLDVDDHKGIQGSTLGLKEQFGPLRVFGTPLSEDAMTGIAIGAAMAGRRPIHVHIRMDFMLLAMNQLINIAAKAHYMYEGQVKVPLVIRTMVGRSWGQGAQHSQSLHSLFMHIPGLKVIAPSNPHDAKGMLIAAIRDDNPVVFIEHRLLYNTKNYVNSDCYSLPIGKARIFHQGSDITIVAVSHMVIEALRAQKLLAQVGISAEIIDPVTLHPMDYESIVASLKKTKKLLIVDNAWLNCGLSSELMAKMVEMLPHGIDDKPLQMSRMGFAHTPCPTTRVLEDLFYPNAITISQQAFKMVASQELDISHLKLEAAKEIESFKGPF
ncbi:alpha-ketoacid dehydrogenase subunit beta [Rickettsiales endosymbiont of Stachyamoeba lipophora]|nr:alpha-ketoacid dehydrogenase subunit beta [Rickettsiales endosymbiont of Stachyamoeba lipophora]